jgi:pimeloyl-ACP methyl ester carboxylesterase
MDKEIKIAGKTIFYRVIGNGKPVMLVHGFGEMGDVWNHQAGPPQTPHKEGLSITRYQLAENSFSKVQFDSSGSQVSPLRGDLEGANGFMFIIPDLPGTGKSEMIDDMSVEGMAEVLKEILDKEIFEQSGSSQIPPSGGGGALIGHSMGGYIVLAFAEKYESYLSAFGLFHSTAFPDTEEKKAIRRKGIEFIKEHGAFEFLKTTTPNLFSPRSKDEFPQLIDQFIQSLNNFSVESLVSYYEAMIKRPDRVHVLKDTRLPVLFIAGEFDNAVPLQDVLKQCHLPGKSYFHVLHQSGHMGMLEETDKSNRLLEEFLNAI